MKIEVIIMRNKQLNKGNSFGLSFLKLINDEVTLNTIIKEHPAEIAMLIKTGLSDGI